MKHEHIRAHINKDGTTTIVNSENKEIITITQKTLATEEHLKRLAKIREFNKFSDINRVRINEKKYSLPLPQNNWGNTGKYKRNIIG